MTFMSLVHTIECTSSLSPVSCVYDPPPPPSLAVPSLEPLGRVPGWCAECGQALQCSFSIIGLGIGVFRASRQTAIVALAVVAALTGSSVSAQKAVADQKAALLVVAKSLGSNFWKWGSTNKWVVASDPCGDAAANPAVPAWDFVTCDATGDITYGVFPGQFMYCTRHSYTRTPIGLTARLPAPNL